MEVVYKKTIVEKIEEAIKGAKYKGKEIEKFILTRGEWDELTKRLIPGALSYAVYSGTSIPPSYCGIPVEVE